MHWVGVVWHFCVTGVLVSQVCIWQKRPLGSVSPEQSLSLEHGVVLATVPEVKVLSPHLPKNPVSDGHVSVESGQSLFS